MPPLPGNWIGALRRRAVFVEEERRERPGVVEAARFLPERQTVLLVFRRRVGGRHEIFFLEVDAGERRRLHGERLRRRIPLAGHVALRHRTFLHTEQRLAIRAIEQEHPGRLADQPERRNAAAVPRDVDECRRRRLIRVPQIVMHPLEVPQILPGVHVHRDDRVGVEVGAGSVAAPVVAGRAAERRCREFRAVRRA